MVVIMNNNQELSATNECIEREGYLNKWTNYIYGWQNRWVVLKDHTLSYYKEKNDTECGCRGAICLFNASIKPNEFDPCRFDIAVDDLAWCLRAESVTEKEHWIKAIISAKQSDKSIDDNVDFSEPNRIQRYESRTSLLSSNISGQNTFIFQKSPVLKSKLIEIDTLRESLCRQIDNLQEQYIQYMPSDPTTDTAEETVEKSAKTEFRVDVMTCKTTASSISEILANCIEIVSLQEDAFAKCVEQHSNNSTTTTNETTNHRTSSAMIDVLFETNDQRLFLKPPVTAAAICEYQTNNNQTYEDEQFFDAEEQRNNNAVSNKLLDCGKTKEEQFPAVETTKNNRLTMSIEHRLSQEVEKVTNEQVRYAKMGVGEGGKDGWQLFADEGEMKMYKRTEEVNGIVVDPLKACHYVPAFTAHEICNYFFKPEFRYEWETTLEAKGMRIVETLSEDTIIFHQIHKRVWPTAQRDVLFWSHMRQLPKDDADDENILNSFVVVNHSTNCDSPQLTSNSHYVRMNLTVSLLCQTVILDSTKKLSDLTRKDIACKIMYCAVINPGGWVPQAGLRLVYKKEYPRFLRKFTAYVTEKTKNQPIIF